MGTECQSSVHLDKLCRQCASIVYIYIEGGIKYKVNVFIGVIRSP